MNGQAMLAITSHGNAPYLMAARVARALQNRPVVIPLYYGETQKRILREEIHENHNNIYLSAELGKLLTPLLLDVKNGQSFAEFAENLAEEKNPTGVAAIEKQLNSMLESGIPAESLDGTCTRLFTKANFAGVLVSALPIRVNLPRKYFFFTALLSQLYGTAPVEHPDEETTLALERQQGYARYWLQMEADCDLRFIPRIHAFSYNDESLQNVIHTPPLSFTRSVDSNGTKPGVLFSPSGTGTDTTRLVKLAGKVPTTLEKYVLAGMRDPAEFSPQKFSRVHADAYGDPAILWVASRGGWGTVWECEMNLKPMILVETAFVDDPEMGHSQKALAHLGLAKVFRNGSSDFPTEDERGMIFTRLQQERANDKQLFGEESTDGFAFIAGKILEHEQA